MKKNYNLTNNHHKEGQELSKKIYRSISDNVKRLDDARGCANQILDLFKPMTQVQRSKLQEYCERLIFSEPLSYGVKVEELLWRKGYYDVISTAKRLKKQEYTLEEKSSLIAHINAGIGHYHHYISRLQTEFELNLEGTVDFFILDSKTNTKATNDNSDLREYALSSLHRSLIYLGDLSRYKLDVYPNWDPNLAVRYYSQALHLKPEYGMPHNQMGTLASTLNLHLDATYHYIQCIMSKHSFEGTENNLHLLFEKNLQYIEQLPVENPDADCIIQLEPTEHIKRFIARFLMLTDVWFFKKKIAHVYDLCHQTNLDLQECLSFIKPVASETSGSQNEDQGDTESVIFPAYLSSDMIFKIVVICLLCIAKLQHGNNSQQLSNVIAFTLAIYSQLIQNVLNHIQEGILNLPTTVINKKDSKKKKTLRRRKKLSALDDSDDDDQSEVELSLSEESDADSEIDISESSESSNDDDDEEEDNLASVEQTDSKAETDIQSSEAILKKSKLIDTKDLIDIIADEIYLASLKILSDWLITDADVLKSCGKTTRSLFVQIVNLLNLLNIDLKRLKMDRNFRQDLMSNKQKMPLPEDHLLQNIEVLKNAYKDVEWNYFGASALSKKDEVLLRTVKLVDFGHRLAGITDTGVSYDNKKGEFSVVLIEQEVVNLPTLLDDSEPTDNGNSHKQHENKKQLMKHMGQLWLAAEVKDLETRVKGKMTLSPYLVVDVESLIKYTVLVKQLVGSKKFIVLVPSAVLSALDDLKKERAEARDVIRWLESQFRTGNRFFRAQRAQERLQLPFIKYPKKKDKDSYIFIQIIECCHYLAKQQKGSGGTAGSANLVTLLMADKTSTTVNPNENKEFSYVGIAQSAGVNLEQITEFHAKWKKSNKGKR